MFTTFYRLGYFLYKLMYTISYLTYPAIHEHCSRSKDPGKTSRVGYVIFPLTSVTFGSDDNLLFFAALKHSDLFKIILTKTSEPLLYCLYRKNHLVSRSAELSSCVGCKTPCCFVCLTLVSVTLCSKWAELNLGAATRELYSNP